jgi:phosphoglycolate phosphatase
LITLPSPVRAVLFDFDYTLGDSSPAAVDCLRYALSGLGLPDRDRDACARTIGLALPDALVALAGPENAPLSLEFHRLFMERADEVMVAWATVYPFAGELLAILRAAGIRTGIVSNKERFRIEGILTRFGLSDVVDTIVGAGDVAAPKPAPDAILLGVERLGVVASETLYVGDNLVDARAAAAAGVAFVGVTTGHTTAVAFAPWQPLAVLPDAGGVPDLLGVA